MNDRVILKGLWLFAKHGPFDAEAELGQLFYVDVTAGADLACAERDDDAKDTIDWADLVEVTTNAFMGHRYKLIEAAGAAVVTAILDHFASANSVRVEIRKPSAPIEAIFSYTSIVIERSRGQARSS